MIAKKLHSLTLLICVIASIVTGSVSGEHNMFRRSEMNIGENIQLGSPYKTWLSNSRTECVRACVRLGGQCGAVEFDQLSGNCTIGTIIVVKSSDGPSPTQPQPQQQLQQLQQQLQQQQLQPQQQQQQLQPQQQPSTMFYSRRQTCDTKLGFSYIVKSDQRSCLYVSNEKVTRGKAVEICRQKGAILYDMRTNEKYQILKEKINGDTSYIRIGLMDRTGNKAFSWDLDGKLFETSDPLWDIFWAGDQPTYSKPDHRCVVLKDEGMKLYDSSCSLLRGFSCELPLV